MPTAAVIEFQPADLPPAARQGAGLWARPAPLPPAMRRDPTTSYAEDIQMLEGLIQRDLGHWLADSPRPCNLAEDTGSRGANVPA